LQFDFCPTFKPLFDILDDDNYILTNFKAPGAFLFYLLGAVNMHLPARVSHGRIPSGLPT
jgi:hypothetical protein